jgi:hypothetical protein
VSVLLVHPGHLVYVFGKDDETFHQEKAPKKGREKEPGPRIKVQASKQPKRGEPQGGKGKPLRIETSTKTSTSRLKHIN